MQASVGLLVGYFHLSPVSLGNNGPPLYTFNNLSTSPPIGSFLMSAYTTGKWEQWKGEVMRMWHIPVIVTTKPAPYDLHMKMFPCSDFYFSVDKSVENGSEREKCQRTLHLQEL